ncbi:MAG: TolC family protein [Phycisphaerales bacterium]|nr:TolC family protein [Phycisphaerales bacterium]
MNQKQPRTLCAHLAVALVPIGAAGCATVDSRPDYDRAVRYVGQAVGDAELYRPDSDEVIEQRANSLLGDGLSANDAVHIALLNNPKLQATTYRLGISRADFVQSGLFTNPTLSFSLRWPDGGGLTNLQAGLAQNIAELWQISYRKQAAAHDLDRTILDVAREASVVAQDARIAYWRAVRADRERDLAAENGTLAQKLVDVAVSRRDAGAGSDVDVNLARSQQTNAELRLRKATLAAIEARAGVAKFLGLITPPGDLVLVDALIDPDAWTLSPEQVVSTGMESRLDVQATKMAVAAASARVEFERSRFLRSVELGWSAERSARSSRGGRNLLAETAFASLQSGQLTPPSLEPHDERSSEWVIGPEIGAELPIFDQNQAQIARAEFVHQQAAKLLEALARELAQDAHVALQRARTASDNARFYADTVLPLREQGLTLAHGAYTAGRTTLLSVQEAQRLLLEARSGRIDTLMDYAVAVVELERVAGRTLGDLLEAAAASDGNDAHLPTPTPSSQTAEENP